MRVNKGDILDVPLGGLAREEGTRSRDRRCPCAEGGDDPAADSRFIVLLFVLWHLTSLRRDRRSGYQRSLFPVTRHLKVPGLGPRKREASLRTLMGLLRKILPGARQGNPAKSNETGPHPLNKPMGERGWPQAAPCPWTLLGLTGFLRPQHDMIRAILSNIAQLIGARRNGPSSCTERYSCG